MSLTTDELRAFLKDKRDKVWTDHSWTEISDAAGKLRAGLAVLGVRPGDRVAILSDNCPEWIVVDQAVQIFGGYGYMREVLVERLFRDARLYPIGGGTREIMNEIIAKSRGY